jgi:hypothetical protein
MLRTSTRCSPAKCPACPSPSEFHEPAAGVAVHDHDDRPCRTAGSAENKVLWENPALVFRQEYEAQSGQTALDPTAFFGQDQNALERMTTEFSRSIVSAILEAF